MSDEETYKDEAIRLHNKFPLPILERLAASLPASGFTLRRFDAKIDLGDGSSVHWKVVTKLTHPATHVAAADMWLQIVALFSREDLKVVLLKQENTRRFRTHAGRREFVGNEREFKIEFEPMADLNVSLL